MSDLNLCCGCMEPLGSDSVCAHCGYDQNTTSLANYLKPGTMLHERFYVGKMLEANGEGVTYIGYDTSTDCKVQVREYFPERLCSRVPNSSAVNVNYDHLAQYKALMAEYTELNKALARLRHLSHLNPALDMFSENNTTYAVYEYLEGGTLLEYLKENAGELSWNIVRRIFPPLFTTLSLLHNAGVLHRGLSPETIYVTERGELKLLGFSISAVRTNDTELDAELFDGYAAPEQYFADRQQGTWTDVYGICAVLYRILTGCRATDAISRQDYDILVPPAELNPQIPEHVSEAIMQGLKLDSSERIRSITDLVMLLFDKELPEQESDDSVPAGSPDKEATAVFQTHSQSGRTGQHRTAGTGQQPAARPRSSSRSGHPQQGGQRRPQNGQRRPEGTGQRRSEGTGQHRSAGTGQHRSSGSGQQRSGRPQGDAARRSGTQSRSNPANRGGAPNRSAAQRRNPQQGRPNSRRPQNSGRYRDDELTVFERIRAPLLIAFLFIAIVTIVVIALSKILNLNQNNTLMEEESSVTESVNVPEESKNEENQRYEFEVPNLVGMNYQIKRDEMKEKMDLDLEAEYDFDEHIAKDQIFWQEFEMGTEIASGSTMKVKVSLGSSIITIPAFNGLRLQSYLKKLEEMGLSKAVDGGGTNNMGTGTVQGTTANGQNGEAVTTSKYGNKASVIYKATVNYNFKNGYVCNVEPEVGKLLDAKDDYEIIVYYAYNPVNEPVANASTMSTSGNGKKVTKTTKTTAKTSHTESRATEAQQPPQQQTLPPATLPPVTNPPAPDVPPVTNPPVSDPPAPPPVSDPPAPVTPPDNGAEAPPSE